MVPFLLQIRYKSSLKNSIFEAKQQVTLRCKSELARKEMERKSLWTACCSVSAILLLVVLFFCFMIMVIADYLKAHFDMAEAARGRAE